MLVLEARFLIACVFGLTYSADSAFAGQAQASERKPSVDHVHFAAGGGTPPNQQGFRLVETGPKSPLPVVDGKILRQGPTTDEGTQYWRVNSIPLDFSAAGRGVSVEWVVRVDQSTYHHTPHFRTGWHVGVRDQEQRLLLVFVGTDRVALVNGDPDRTPAVAEFDAAGRFHHYRLVVDDERAMLFVDGNKRPLLTRTVGRPEPEEQEDQTNLVYFGDGTQLAGGKALVKDFYYTNDSAAKSPFHPAADR